MVFKREFLFLHYLFPKIRKSRCKTLLNDFSVLQQLLFFYPYIHDLILHLIHAAHPHALSAVPLLPSGLPLS